MSKRIVSTAATLTLAALLSTAAAAAPPCPPAVADHIPVAAVPLNIDLVKAQLRDYHDRSYEADLADVYAAAEKYIKGRLGEKLPRPAIVLDIDETILSNWRAIVADDFGFFAKSAACNLPSDEACGFNKWIDRAEAEALEPARRFFNEMKGSVQIFLISARRDQQRMVTFQNLERAGYSGWAGLVTRPDNDTNPSPQSFKTLARQRIQADGYTILANIGDQLSDLDGGRAADCPFKLPNPFYFIK
jgi:predicted secreted acid phosphatase